MRPSGMQQIVATVQELSEARSLDAVMKIVRTKARHLTGADGATFVLRDGDKCFYAEEDAIEPLWKGLRFPMSACISGWSMLNKQPAAIADIYADPRIPADAYRPTFVKSLLMVPIRSANPIGAIGNYWAERHAPSDEEIELLRALADTTSVALENVQLYEELEERVRRRTTELASAVDRLEHALKEVKTLRGLLPICSHCHQIRDQAGSWQRLERYLAEHANAEFTHSICPVCVERHYQDA